MKKLTALLLGAAMVLSLAACGGTASSSEAASSSEGASSEAASSEATSEAAATEVTTVESTTRILMLRCWLCRGARRPIWSWPASP